MNKLTVAKDDLKKAMDIVFEKIASSINDNVCISNDYYLHIHMDEAYDFEKNVEPAIGSLFDDWENLCKVISKQQHVTFVDIDRLSSILKAISQELNPPEK
jgi:hypothetical protein